MKTSQEIIELIKNEAPRVYQVLTELCMEYHEGFISDNPDWWDQLSDEDRSWLLIEHLTESEDDNHDVSWWAWRYFQMLESEKEIQYWKEQYHQLDCRLTPDIDFV